MAKRHFADKVVVVTGAASGIGLAAARRFAKAGAVIALVDKDERRLHDCEKLGYGANWRTPALSERRMARKLRAELER